MCQIFVSPYIKDVRKVRTECPFAESPQQNHAVHPVVSPQLKNQAFKKKFS